LTGAIARAFLIGLATANDDRAESVRFDLQILGKQRT
jgi:hypothetical protein